MSWWLAVLLQYYSVLQSTTPILLRTTNTTLYYSSTTLYYKVLLKYYSVLLQHYLVLQSTTPVLTCTTKYYSSTILYYKVLLQYYPVLQSTTPVLLCTTKYYPILLCTTNTTLYYSSATLYYKVPLKYYSVLPCTTKYYSSTTPYYKVLHDWSASHMKRHLQCAEQQKAASNFSKYCACHAKWISWLIRIAYETSFTMRRATGSTPSNLTNHAKHHIWNVIYNARSDRHHPATSPNTAPATQNESHDWSTSHTKRHLQCAEQQASPSNLTKYCACHAKWISWLICITYETSFTMGGATGISLQPHQILRLPRKMNLMIDPHRIWNVIYNARSDRHQPPTSPNTAPATQNCTPKS